MDNHNCCLHSIWSGLTRCGRNKQFVSSKDREVFERRTACEGAEFYARHLAGLRSALLEGLETGQLVVPDTLRFKKRNGTQLPAFLYGAWKHVFSDEGMLLTSTLSVDAVSCLNQLTAVFGKIKGGHTKESESLTLQRFIDNEVAVSAWTAREQNGLLHSRIPLGKTGLHSETLLRHASVLVRRVLAKSDPRDIRPKHGSGMSACGTLLSERYDTPRYVKNIDAVWSYSDYYFLGIDHVSDYVKYVDKPGQPQRCELDLEEYIPCAKILLVPKDAKGPRIISCEPRETMWIQQGLMDRLVTDLEAHPLTQGLVNFTDQRINQKLAHRGSITHDLATLDLSDASDMLSLRLVERLFPPNWVEALSAARSPCTQMPDGQIVTLSKHAPMGSAVCFPVMALSIWALLTAYTTINPESSKESKDVYVYGDDIIVSSSFADGAVSVLERFGFKINRSKSFSKGPFRESCGKEYVNGTDVTPVRLRMLPTSDIESQMRFIAFHNNLYERYGVQPDWLTELIHEKYKGIPERSTYYHREVDKDIASLFCDNSLLWGDPNTYVNNKALSFVLNVYRACNRHLRSRMHKDFQVPVYRCLAVVPRRIKYTKDRWSQVFRSVVNPRLDEELGLDALPKRVSYKYRWLRLY